MKMMAGTTEAYVPVKVAARVLGITENRIRYWMMIDPHFPRGVRNGRTVLRPSEVAEYFRRRDEVVTIAELSDEDGEYDDDEGE